MQAIEVCDESSALADEDGGLPGWPAAVWEKGVFQRNAGEEREDRVEAES